MDDWERLRFRAHAAAFALILQTGAVTRQLRSLASRLGSRQFIRPEDIQRLFQPVLADETLAHWDRSFRSLCKSWSQTEMSTGCRIGGRLAAFFPCVQPPSTPPMKSALLEQLRNTVHRQPTRLDQLHAQVRDAGSLWSPDQLRLVLETYAGFKVGDGADPETTLGEVTPEEELLAAVRQILSTEPGRPVPVARVIELLPANLTTSLEQLRALAAKTSDLEIRGPMIRRKPGN